MGRSSANVQESFLNLCRRENTRCVVYLVNGVQLRGVIKGFDSFTILLEDDSRQQMVYKHAVTTVQPLRRLPDLERAVFGPPAPEEEPEPTPPSEGSEE